MIVLIAEGMHESGMRLLHKQGIRTVVPSDRYKKNEVDTLIVRSVSEVNKKTIK